jgi:hypothetical protein
MMEHNEKNEIQSQDLEFAEGEFVNIKQCTIRAVEGGHIELQQVGALSIDGEKVDITQGASVVMRSNDMFLNQSVCAISAANNVSINYSFTPLSLSREETNANRSAIGIMAAKEINSENTTSFLVLSGKVNGNITTVLDWRSAIALGAVFGGIWGFFSLLFKKK